MHWPVPLLLPLLAMPVLLLTPGCTEPTGAFVAANAASVVVFGRAIPDLAVSGVTGRDCSVVRLDQGKSYCAPAEGPPPPQRFCTRSLGTVDCWSGPAALPEKEEGVADGPNHLTAEQERQRTARWPKSLNLPD